MAKLRRKEKRGKGGIANSLRFLQIAENARVSSDKNSVKKTGVRRARHGRQWKIIGRRGVGGAINGTGRGAAGWKKGLKRGLGGVWGGIGRNGRWRARRARAGRV
jgi:hypothetical protein